MGEKLAVFIKILAATLISIGIIAAATTTIFKALGIAGLIAISIVAAVAAAAVIFFIIEEKITVM